MISRRLLRIKALMILYAFNRRDDNNLVQAEKELDFSITKTYDLYHLVLSLILEISDIAAEKIDFALQKKMPTEEDLNPNRKFVNNAVVDQLRNNPYLKKYLSANKLTWTANSQVPRKLYAELVCWETYREYMSSSENTYSADKKFIIKLITELIIKSEDLTLGLEEQSIYWNDDIDFVAVIAEKTIKKFKPGDPEKNLLMPLYKNDEDKDFVKILLRKAILLYKDSSDLIDKNTTNWEVERIALMDILVMKLAITEIISFPDIPVKVTLNEYIEIAKYYCTSKSSTFVNGILDKVVREMKEKDLFRKSGRGLVGDSVKDE
jgi:transcription antitermination protein NusB